MYTQWVNELMHRCIDMVDEWEDFNEKGKKERISGKAKQQQPCIVSRDQQTHQFKSNIEKQMMKTE